MERKTPKVVPGHIGDSSNVYKAHKCVSDFRNTGKQFTVKGSDNVLYYFGYEYEYELLLLENTLLTRCVLFDFRCS